MDVLFIIVKSIRIFYILYWLDSYLYVFLDFYTIVYIYIFCGIVCYLDSIYIILAAVIIISSIIYIYFCVVHSVNFCFSEVHLYACRSTRRCR